MGVFAEVKLTWEGEDFVVPPEQVMGLIAVIEEEATVDELLGGRVKRGMIAKAYGAALRYAGAKVLDEDVYTTLFGKAAMTSTIAAIDGLMKMLIPPEHLQAKNTQQGRPGTKKPGKRAKSPSKA